MAGAEESSRRTGGDADPGAALPEDLGACTAARRAAEAAGDDAALLRLRRLERAHQGLPPLLDGARPQRMAWADAISTTWTAWDAATGQRLLLRCLRPSWREDAVMRRRLARGAVPLPAPLRAPTLHLQGDWPHLRLALPGPLLSDLPDPLPPLLTVLAGALPGLAALHAAGHTLGGGDPADHLALCGEGAGSGVALVWLDRFDARGSPAEDLRALAGWLIRAAPPAAGMDAIEALVEDWACTPPPSAEDAAHLLKQAMAATLLQARRSLLRAHHARRLAHDHLRLRDQILALARAAPPPPARLCLEAPPDGPPTLATSDGRHLYGGVSAGVPEDLSRLASVEAPGEVDVAACRALLRAARRRRPEDEDRRLAAQARLGGGDEAGLLRWLRGWLEVRSLLLLEEQQLRRHAAAAAPATPGPRRAGSGDHTPPPPPPRW